MDPEPQQPIRAKVVAAPDTGHEALLDRLAIPVCDLLPPGAFQLVARQGVLELRPPDEAARAGIRAAFPPDAGRRGPAAGRSHPLVRAFGPASLPILDLTAGLGADAYRLAEAGHRVRAAERDPVVFALLVTAWQEACRAGRVPPSIAARLEFVHAEGSVLLGALDGPEFEGGALANAGRDPVGDDGFDAGGAFGVYLDPMYPPPRKASALPRREIQVLRRLLGASDDLASLVARARTIAARVVVKRPHHACPVASGASFGVLSKLVRFDVYLDPRRMGAGPR